MRRSGEESMAPKRSTRASATGTIGRHGKKSSRAVVRVKRTILRQLVEEALRTQYETFARLRETLQSQQTHFSTLRVLQADLDQHVHLTYSRAENWAENWAERVVPRMGEVLILGKPLEASGLSGYFTAVSDLVGASPTSGLDDPHPADQELSAEDWEAIKKEVVSLLRADLLDTPERHLAYVRARLGAVPNDA